MHHNEVSIGKGENGIGGKFGTIDIHHEDGSTSQVSVIITSESRLEVQVIPSGALSEWVIDLGDSAIALVEDGERVV